MDQHRLFNPKKEDMVMGSTMEAASGNKAIQKIAKRGLDMSRGNVASYLSLLNGPHQLAQFQEANERSSVSLVHASSLRLPFGISSLR